MGRKFVTFTSEGIEFRYPGSIRGNAKVLGGTALLGSDITMITTQVEAMSSSAGVLLGTTAAVMGLGAVLSGAIDTIRDRVFGQDLPGNQGSAGFDPSQDNAGHIVIPGEVINSTNSN